MNFNNLPKINVTIASFSTLVEKNSFFFIYQIKWKKPTYFKPKTVQTLHFPLKKNNFIV